MSAPTTSAAAVLEPGYVKQRAQALVRDGRGARVLLIHARPQWDGERSFVVRDPHDNNRTVHVRAGISQLAILDAYAELPDGDFLVVLTDRSRQDLGDAVLLRAWRRDVELPDVWNAVPALYGARNVSRELRRVGTWVPNALLSHAPAVGWPASPGPEVSASWALENLIASLLGLAIPEQLDADLVLGVLGEPDARQRWNAVDTVLRNHLIAWASDAVGPAVGFALQAGASGRNVAPLAVGLAVDVLWNVTESAVERGLAQARLMDRYLGASHGLTAEPARTIADASRVSAVRRVLSDPDGARNVLAQAEALLADLGWADGAAASELLPAGLRARLRSLGRSLALGAANAEAALDVVLQHALALPGRADVVTARMAVRLTRWLETREEPAGTLSASLRAQVDDGAWVDRAIAHLWNASDDPELAAQYAELVGRVQARRNQRDRVAATQLAAHTAAPVPLDGAVPVEDLLAQVAKPWASGGVLVVVLDGMSTAVATEVAEAATELGLVEWVPGYGRRVGAVAVLPSLTELSRASLLTGLLTKGAAATEKKGFASVFANAPLFHKDDLRADAGAQLPPAVYAAIAGTATRPVVGVVLNAIDDTLHKQDTSGVHWTIERLAPLRALLVQAAGAGRTVILTADHGHVVERSTEALSVPGASARWRPVGSGPVADGEVLVEGPRVLTDDGRAVMLWREDAHYGPRYPGYHGGASLAEITVPVIVLRPAHLTSAVAPGWIPAPPQAPGWWNEPTRSAVPLAAAKPMKQKKRAKRVDISEPTGDGLFDVVITDTPDAAGTGDLADAVLASDVYAVQKQRAGRRAASDEQVAGVLRALIEKGGRAHRETIARVLGVPSVTVDPALVAIKRVLNVDAYGVLEVVDGGEWVRLDEPTLREQFGVA
ncbi:BREX-2 system phosphatase PglZ [Cellulosimicrobium composti]|uniref:BREX-2 system phosphatase PglZ n=1 Tax=Cellulosimicrobium composti TaxID=2672572 RepID=UPI0018ACA053|nr:BREX-2 system phosphatase PglZ [Cellulosimicrobium composti]